MNYWIHACHVADYFFSITGIAYLKKTFTPLLLFILLLPVNSLQAQHPVIGKKTFFTDQYVIDFVLVTDMKKLGRERLKNDSLIQYQPAAVTFILPDSTRLAGDVEIKLRGNFRREECPQGCIMVNFNTVGAPLLKKLGRLKLVWPCGFNAYTEQLVLKEFLVYKMYNLLTEKSFRVRLVNMTCYDINEKIKPQTFYAFFIEDTDDMAKRNDCKELNNSRVMTEQTDRQQTTLVSLFEYMIGNTDWAVPMRHNIKLLRSKEDSTMLPYAVPYDFDYCGLVDADYAVPPPELGIATVRDRLYRGFVREQEELQTAAQIFLDQRKAIDSLVRNFIPLNKYEKKDMLQYLNGFYEIISDEKKMKTAFIDRARKL